MVATVARADPIGTSANIKGTLWYPNHGPDSIGNETQVQFLDNSGFVPGNAGASAHLAETRTGTDIGTAGTTTLEASSSASIGHLSATSQVSATAHYDGDSSVYYAHGAAKVEPISGYQASFADTTVVFNPDYVPGTLIPVEVSLLMNWDHGYDVGLTGWSFADTEAYANLSVQGVAKVSASNGERTDIPLWMDAPQSIDFLVANGGTFTWSSSLAVYSTVSLAGAFENHVEPRNFPDVGASAFSNASLDITPTSGFAGTTFTSVTGYVYGSDETAPSVPDATSTVALPGLGLGAIGVARRRTSLVGCRG
jgi:hypothetical protein